MIRSVEVEGGGLKDELNDHLAGLNTQTKRQPLCGGDGIPCGYRSTQHQRFPIEFT